MPYKASLTGTTGPKAPSWMLCMGRKFHRDFWWRWVIWYVPSVPVHFIWSFLAAVTVLVFHVAMVIFSLPWILDGATVACLTLPSWCGAESMILVNPGGDQASMVWLFVVGPYRKSQLSDHTGRVSCQTTQEESVVRPHRKSQLSDHTGRVSCQIIREESAQKVDPWKENSPATSASIQTSNLSIMSPVLHPPVVLAPWCTCDEWCKALNHAEGSRGWSGCTGIFSS